MCVKPAYGTVDGGQGRIMVLERGRKPVIIARAYLEALGGEW